MKREEKQRKQRPSTSVPAQRPLTHVTDWDPAATTATDQTRAREGQQEIQKKVCADADDRRNMRVQP